MQTSPASNPVVQAILGGTGDGKPATGKANADALAGKGASSDQDTPEHDFAQSVENSDIDSQTTPTTDPTHIKVAEAQPKPHDAFAFTFGLFNASTTDGAPEAGDALTDGTTPALQKSAGLGLHFLGGVPALASQAQTLEQLGQGPISTLVQSKIATDATASKTGLQTTTEPGFLPLQGVLKSTVELGLSPNVGASEQKTQTDAALIAAQQKSVGKPEFGDQSGKLLQQAAQAAANKAEELMNSRSEASQSSKSDSASTQNVETAKPPLTHLAPQTLPTTAQSTPNPALQEMQVSVSESGAEPIADADLRPSERGAGAVSPIAATDPRQAMRLGEQMRPIALQMADVVQKGGNGAFEISLRPEELGRLRMSLQPGDGTLHVVLQAERADTMDLLRRNIGSLQQEFLEMGYTDISFEFGSGSTSDPEADGDSSAQDGGEADANGHITSAASPATSTAPDPRYSGGLDMRV